MAYLFDPAPQTAAKIVGESALFPVRRIFCVGKNYEAHVRELGGEKGDPIFFTKPADALVENGAAIPYALNTRNLHFEIELVVAIGRGGVNIAERDALDHVYGYAVGCDLTRRDRQNEAKDKGAPWDVSKAFDQSAPLAPITPAVENGHVRDARIWLAVNGAVKQDANVRDMIWNVSEIIAHLSASFALAAGDLIFTGTPAGVGPLKPGDVVTGGVGDLTELRFSITER